MSLTKIELMEKIGSDYDVGNWKFEASRCDPTNPNASKELCLEDLKFIDDVRATNIFHDVRNAVSKFLKDPTPKRLDHLNAKLDRAKRDLIRISLASLWGRELLYELE